ncbi:MAG: sulfurtransferase, partial [Crocinitomicaceae bacterium]|nr:sulfurtransferase [Crocinitomicaceae bacterium]
KFSEIQKNGARRVIIDCRKPELYANGHIEGSFNVDRPDIADSNIAYGGMMISRVEIAKMLSSFGALSSDHIYLYDDKGGCDATRLWWILYTYGHRNTTVLDGGFTKWKQLGYPVSKKATKTSPSDFQFSHTQDNHLKATMNDVKTAIKDPNTVLLDTRTWEEYLGTMLKDGAYRKGRIPTSVYANWSYHLTPEGNKTLKSTEELKTFFKEKGVTKDKKVIAYCQSGVRSSHTTFILTQLLGFDNVKNYDGSWIEWSYHSKLPIELGELDFNKKKKPTKNNWPIWSALVIGLFAILISFKKVKFN